MKIWMGILALLSVFACAPNAGPTAELGALELGLTSDADGTSYRLTRATFALEGPVSERFEPGDEDVLTRTLPVGSYKLTLEPDFELTRLSGDTLSVVMAKLVSQNPVEVVIAPGITTPVVLRFELEGSTDVPGAKGKLSITLSVSERSESDAGSLDACTSGLRITELDYDQVSADEGEFVEVLNAADCVADLAQVAIEFVNGGDGTAYLRVPLARAANTLAAGARLVLADEAVRATLPVGTPSIALSEDLQNGAPDAVRLVASDLVIDALSYEGIVAGASEGQPAPTDEGEGGLSRCPDDQDASDNALDFRLTTPTPGLANACG